MTLNKADATSALKEFYNSRQSLIKDSYEDNPFLAMVPKFEDWQGKNYRLPIRYATPQGVGTSIGQAQTNLGESKYTDFQLEHVEYFGVARVSGFNIRASKGDIGSFVELMSEEIDGISHSVGRRLAAQLPRNFGGAIGRVGSTSTTTLTLLNPEDVVNFEVGQFLDSDDTDGTSGAADGGSIQIVAIDRDAGTLTGASNWTGAGNFADNDYIFIAGDFGSAISGLDSWCPATAPTSTLHFGVDRTADVTRLGGIRFTDGASLTIDEAIQRGLTRSRREGYKTTHIFMAHERLTDLEVALGDRAVLDTARSEDGVFGFDAIRYRGGSNGGVMCVGDHNFPPDVAYAVDMGCLGLFSLGPAPGILDHDDVGDVLRVSNDDSVEARVGYYAQFGCDTPGSINRISLATGS